jgi:hypothetical protein
VFYFRECRVDPKKTRRCERWPGRSQGTYGKVQEDRAKENSRRKNKASTNTEAERQRHEKDKENEKKEKGRERKKAEVGMKQKEMQGRVGGCAKGN